MIRLHTSMAGRATESERGAWARRPNAEAREVQSLRSLWDERVSIGERSRFRRSPGSPGPKGSSDRATSASSSSDSERAVAKGSGDMACTGAGDTDAGRTGR